MKNLSLRQATLVLMASTALAMPSTFAAEYVISTPTTTTNGGVGALAAGDNLIVEATGSISTTLDLASGIETIADNNIFTIFGSISTTGDASI
ncbi:hypothetical protein MNBD_ALPHA11-714, partial [hydrothermal vent metagenome]